MACVGGGGENFEVVGILDDTAQTSQERNTLEKPRNRGSYSVMTFVTSSGTKQSSQHAYQMVER